MSEHLPPIAQTARVGSVCPDSGIWCARVPEEGVAPASWPHVEPRRCVTGVRGRRMPPTRGVKGVVYVQQKDTNPADRHSFK